MQLLRVIVALSLLGVFLTACGPAVSEQNTDTENMETSTPADLWVGTYTRKEGHVDGKADGIYGLRLDGAKLELRHTEEAIVNPSFVGQSADGKYLYAVSEIGPELDSTGYVYSYRVGGDKLVYLNRQPTFSFAPCHLSVHPAGKWLYVSNYVGGMLVRYPLASDGTIGTASGQLRLEGSGPTSRQEDSHPHSVNVSPDGRWVIVADLGTDKVHTFRADAPEWKQVTEVILPAGAGPRHLAFHPKGKYAYVINELNSSVTAFHYNADNGALNIIAHYPTLPTGADTDSWCADIHLTPDGQYLYASNRGHNSLAAYRVDSSSGTLKVIGHFETQGDFPRNFAIAPDGKSLLVANQNSDNIVNFKIAPETGQLILGESWEVKTPVCLSFVK